MLKKRIMRTRNSVKVSFYTARIKAAESVHLVGDFNNWDETATPMKPLKSGQFTAVLYLEPERDYEFRYLVNGEEWHNDWQADRYAPNIHGSENGVVSTHIG